MVMFHGNLLHSRRLLWSIGRRGSKLEARRYGTADLSMFNANDPLGSYFFDSYLHTFLMGTVLKSIFMESKMVVQSCARVCSHHICMIYIYIIFLVNYYIYMCVSCALHECLCPRVSPSYISTGVALRITGPAASGLSCSCGASCPCPRCAISARPSQRWFNMRMIWGLHMIGISKLSAVVGISWDNRAFNHYIYIYCFVFEHVWTWAVCRGLPP